jgi:type I restriction enzyme S subunit
MKQYVKLSEISEIERGTEPGRDTYCSPTEGIRFLRVGDITGKGYEEIYTNSKNLVLVEEADILMTFDGTPGFVNRGLKGAISSGVRRIIPKDKNILDRNYLFYVLQTEGVRKTVLKYSSGQTIIHASKSIPHIEIPLLPLFEQRRIVDILEKVDALRKKRQEADEAMNNGVLNMALNLFGDPIRNRKKWTIRKFNEIALLERGRFGHRPRTEPRFYRGKYPFIQINDITKSGMMIKEYSQTLNEKGLAISKLFPANTVVVSIASTIGEVGILGFDSCFPDSLVGITPKEEVVTREYIYFYLIYMKSHLNEIAPQLAQKNINLKILNDLDVPLPPLSEQQKFADLVQKVEKIKEKQRESKQELDNIFSAFMQKIFKGESE